MNCEECKSTANGQQKAAEGKIPPVPYIAHEAELARMERVNKRAAIMTVAMAVLAVVTNVIWALHFYGLL